MERFSERRCMALALSWATSLCLLYTFVLAPYLSAMREAAYAARMEAQVQCARVDAYHQMLLRDTQAEEKLHLRQLRLARALPEGGGQGAFIHASETFARRSGVTIDAVTAMPAVRTDPLVIQPMELHLHGNYFDVLSFLHGIEEGERAVRFGDFALTTEGTVVHAVLRIEIAAYEGAEQPRDMGHGAVPDK